MRQFTIGQTPESPDQSTCWFVEIDGRRERQYTTQWAAIVGAFVGAHEATHCGEEATVVMKTSASQVWTFSLAPTATAASAAAACPTGQGAFNPVQDFPPLRGAA